MGQPILVLPHLERPKEVGKHHRLLCLSGPLKGKSFFFSAKRIVIGRGEDCDIRITDAQMSRQHAEIVLVGESYTLTDLKSQNGVIVNDKKISQVQLNTGDTVIIGQSVFKYAIVQVGEEGSLNSSLKDKVKQEDNSFASDSPTEGKKNPNSKKNLYILIGLVILGFVLMTDDAEKTKGKQQPSKKFDNTADEFNDVLRKKQLKEDRELKLKLDAIFQRGLRELREGNYFRAMSEFNHALSLSPNNGRASFYLDKAKQSLDSEIEQHFIKGKKNYESLKYNESIQSYCSIARLLQNNQDDDRFVDAMENIKEIEIKVGLAEGEIKCL